jgi:predicted tellurium resistance membrane protein TerC
VDLDLLTDPQNWIALATLSALEIVLGIDNIIFISILVARLPRERQKAAWNTGLVWAMLMRVGLLFTLAWIARLTRPLFEVLNTEISGRDLILMAGGLFLLGKSTLEIHHKLEGQGDEEMLARPAASFAAVIAQIIVMDLIFSLDSVITAIGMSNRLPIMVAAVALAVAVMMLFARAVGAFVDRHPTVQMLALSFLLLIGLSLVAEGLDHHIPKGYLYFAMSFSAFVEMLNLRLRRPRTPPVKLKDSFHPPRDGGRPRDGGAMRPD